MTAGPSPTDGRAAISLVQPVRITVMLAAISLLMSAGHAAGLLARHVFGHPSVHGLVPLFNLDYQTSIPNLFQTLLILFNAALLLLAAVDARGRSRADARMWALLSGAFVCLALDEFAELHARFNGPTRVLLAPFGLGHKAWVIPYAAGAAVLAIAAVPFLKRRTSRVRWSMVAAGALYVVGAAGMDAFEGTLLDGGRTARSAAMGVMSLLEESCEMAGMTLFACAVMCHLAERVTVLVGLGTRRPLAGARPATVVPLASARGFARAGQNGVEQQPERRVRLAPVLRAESDQDHPPQAGPGLDDGRLARNGLLAFEPAAQQEVLLAVAGDDAHAGRCARVVG